MKKFAMNKFSEKTERIEKLIEDVEKAEKIYVWLDVVRKGMQVGGEYFTISKEEFLHYLSDYKGLGYTPLSYYLGDGVVYFIGENK